MTSWLTILFALWIYPITAYFLLRLTRSKPKFRKYFFITVSGMVIITILGLLTNVSTTFSTFDWFCVTSVYLLICLLLWYSYFQSNKIIKGFGFVLMVLTFSIGYISGTIGALGIGFLTAEYDTDKESRLEGGLIYKESILGNAVSDYRGKKVEVYRTLSWLPIIEWRTQHKEYYNWIPYATPLNVEYRAEEKKIYLSASTQDDKQTISWTDTLELSRKYLR